jgi:alpha-beta hydrolase superfamily lysophospholipase
VETTHELDFEWVHIAYEEQAAFSETYGFSGTQGLVNLEGVRILPRGVKSRTLQIYMHPASTLQLLPVPRAAARRGAHVLCAGSRYARNDTAAIFEKIALDLGAYIRHAKEVWGYERVVLVGWSGGGSLALFYQSQAEAPSVTATPAGDPVDLTKARLIPADAVIVQAAHSSRAQLLVDVIDPSVTDELNPDERDARFDIYSRDFLQRPPFSPELVKAYQAAQLARVRRITSWVKRTLADLRGRGTGEVERGFVTHRTMADLRFLDPQIEPNDRRIGWCYLGKPETVNNGPVGLARFSTLRAWLSQWSIDDTNAEGIACARRLHAPLLAIENTADDAVPQPHTRRVFEAASSEDKQFFQIQGATHYYVGQPELLAEAIAIVRDWLKQRGLA